VTSACPAGPPQAPGLLPGSTLTAWTEARARAGPPSGLLGYRPGLRFPNDDYRARPPWFTCERDLAPFVRLAFPQALTERTELTTAQRTFLGALVANGYQPFGEALCLLLLGT
jgi:hypothetical protein